jgi:hypothetical protein
MFDLKNILLCCLLIFTVGCRFSQPDMKQLHQRQVFDQDIINHLPLYDSLAHEITASASVFQQQIDTNSAYRSFRYRILPQDDNGSVPLPPGTAAPINRIFTALGKDRIYGFDYFSDKTIKLYIRKKDDDSSGLIILEHLSYFPDSTIRRRKFPDKDTILTQHWLYWIQFSRSRLL